MAIDRRDLVIAHTSRRYASIGSICALGLLSLSLLNLSSPQVMPPVLKPFTIVVEQKIQEIPVVRAAEAPKKILADESDFVVAEETRVAPPVEAPTAAEKKAVPLKKKKTIPKPVKKTADAPLPTSGPISAAAAPPAAAPVASAASRQSALDALVREVEKRKKYPRNARRSGAQGTVTLAIVVGADGRVKNCRIGKASGIGLLDQETARLGDKLAGFNTGVNGAEFTVFVSVRYELR